MVDKSKPVLVTGATGYVGGRLVPRLLAAGYRVRACGRSLSKLQARPWALHADAGLREVDVLDLEALREAAAGTWAAYYCVHSMKPRERDFAAADRIAAANMADAAGSAGLDRIIYLGGLGEEGPSLSKHLRSRTEVAEILKQGPTPVTVLRAAMIIGSGSASFEILRYLVDRLPVMITPKWVETPCQPIAIRNVLHYLVECLATDQTRGGTFDIGGAQVLTYRELMEIYAEEAGLAKRFVIPVPFFTPRLSSYWIHLVTPVPAYLARPLAEGLRNPVVCVDRRILDLIPQELFDCRTAIRLALARLRDEAVETHWTDAGVVPPAEWELPEDPLWAGGTVYEDCREIEVSATAEEIWHPLVRVGGKTGWYYGNWLWWLRGLADKLLGGVGISRGRRHQSELAAGDALDFWRVIRVRPCQSLLLVAEMQLPGRALLEFRLTTVAPGVTRLVQTARFVPRGLAGIAYWWAVMPLHELVFSGMLRGIARASKRPVISGPTRLPNGRARPGQ